jgi:fructokinase
MRTEDTVTRQYDLRHHGDAEVGGGLVDLAVNVRLPAPPAWLRDRLAAAGVELDHFRLIPGCGTPLALVTVRFDGEPQFQIYGDGIAATVRAVGANLPAAVAAAEALFLSSNTLAGRPERELTLAARDRALELGRPVLFDPNLRLHRWSSLGEAVAQANRGVPGALLVRCNRTEAELMTGETDPERAAEALVDRGARVVVVTLGADGALLRGEAHAWTPGRPARVVSTVGAGDVFTGVLLARLAEAGFDPRAAAAGLPEAVRESARATERWGAVE